ncbi:TetR family transcriptional regulator [Leptospira interrogans serovar Geyaweera]|nr:TetR family transcriptional regulator [Leptospira interrogans serovar Geyaweera]
MAVNAGLGAATGAASGGLKGALVGAVGGAAGAAVRSFTGGAVTVGLSYSAENGFGASVGVGYGPANVTVGISEKGGATVDLGFNKGGFNAGLSYNSKTGKASGSAGFSSSDSGTGFALSYNEGDGFGASISKSLDNGINGSLSWSEKGGVGGNIGYEVPGDKNKSKDSLANKMQGSGGSLNWSQRDGVSVAVNASGGVNAGNWSQSGGFQANTNFLTDQWKANFISGKAKEDADAQEASRAAQKEAAAHSGADSIAGAGETLLGGRRNDGDASASADPDDQRIAQLKKELSEGILLADGNGSMSDVGGGSGTASAAKELSKKMAELQQLESNKAARSNGAEKPGILGGIGERFSNLINGNGFNTNASLNSGPVKIVSGTGGGKATGDILEDSNGKLYQKQTNKKGETEWVPVKIDPKKHAEGQALMAQGAANGDLAAYSKGLAMTKGYGWNDNGLNMVGIRVPVDSQNAKHDDFMLAINKGKLEGVYFASTQPGQKSYEANSKTGSPSSAALGGVGEISTGHFNMVGVDKTAGTWKHAYLAGMADGTVPGARDANADGVHSTAERSMENLKKMTEVFIHQGGNDSVNFTPNPKTKTLIADYMPGKVGGISQGCQVPNQSYYHNAQTGQNEVFATSGLNKMAGQHGSFNSMETLFKNNPKFGYSVINSSDFTTDQMNQLNDLRKNAKEEFMQAETQNYLKKKPQYKDYDVQFNR